MNKINQNIINNNINFELLQTQGIKKKKLEIIIINI